jgi:hypothetical protein
MTGRPFAILVSGLRSVGKSSFVCSLWGDTELLPTAERDCTQTNTRIRIPAPGEADRGIGLAYLPRAKALDYATRDLSFCRLAEFLAEALGPFAPRLDELTPEARLREATAAVRRVFRQRPDLYVLHEHLTDEVEKLEQFLAFLDSPAYRPGETVAGAWEERREQLMGRRRPDGRTVDVGKLLALAHVELVRATGKWGQIPFCPSKMVSVPIFPVLIDTPWVPAFHNARRAELILAEARTAEVLVIVARPELLQVEDWVTRILSERPALAARTLVAFNQVDTADLARLFARDGLGEVFAENRKRLRALGVPRENLFVSCTRLPFLENSPAAPGRAERLAKLREVLGAVRERAASAPKSAAPEFREKLRRATEPDGGLEAVRERLVELRGTGDGG